MVQNKKGTPAKVATKTFTVKKCPYCYTYVAVKDMRCQTCGKRVGVVDPSGWARKVIDWKAYLAAIVFITIFVAFCWWAFMAN